MTFARTEIPRQSAVAILVAKDQVFRVVNSEGQQVVDTWMFKASNPGVYLSMAHSRTATYRLFFQPYVELCALQDLLLVCSACPSTVGTISGGTTRGAAIDLKG